MLPDIFTNLQFSRTSSGSNSDVKLNTSPLSMIVSTLFVLLAIHFWGGGTSWAASSSLKAASGFADAAGLPGELGKIVYQKNTASNIQLFIIGNSHRSSASGENGSHTVPAQIQTYRIAEWLIRQHQVELLLPEGFFGRQERTGIPDAIVRHDDPTLEEALADTSTFINADLLLHRNYGIALHQVEDRDLYRNVREFLLSNLKSGNRFLAPFGLELGYLQERRSAAILQKIPAVINAEYRQGHIAQPRAILTIGVTHLDEMIKFLKTERIEVYAPPLGASGFQDYREDLDLMAQEVGVTVIVPRVILADREMMSLANLQP
ncbi:MAG: hypothetical protein CVU69_07000 [Deltaproteobacteria bacterium HGW-Deltaproteobacteria-4]|nr:MAG: hypothetical protein CVU69_07000 [Deltaproteobacteria bacterium HGW-Deltaproteobacteria-4]